MQFINLTRQLEIGANSYLLKTAGRNILLDAGLHPKTGGLAALPNFSFLNNNTLDAIVITHAHQDHIGSLPYLTRSHRNTRVYMTPATAAVAEIMLHNSVNVMLRQREDADILEYPLFTHRGVEFCSEAWELRNESYAFFPNDPSGNEIADLRIKFFDAGHILGSMGVLIESEGRSLFYTGDVNFDAQSILQGAQFPTEGIDILVMEATRGDSATAEGFTREAEELRLAKSIRDAFDRGGAVTIPVFALGKTQELLAMLWKMRRQGLLPPVPIYIGGLSYKITTLYDSLASATRRKLPELQLLRELSPHVIGGMEIGALQPQKRCIFALSSGMMSENTLSNVFARRILETTHQSLFFIGYADPQSPAGKIRRAELGHEIILDPKLPPLKMRCQRQEFNFSAHASRESLLTYALRVQPKTILLIHGDPPALEWFKNNLSTALPHTRIVISEPGQMIHL
ncbi:MAG: MBL fold metallo-hydrolase [Verrucomicrobia bacterium]|nr:MAG: MBL fold metallo-hydrolase [Verrucomicrobiota bacterium]